MKIETKQIIYKSAKSPKQLAEHNVVHEILTKLKTSSYIRNRKYRKGHMPAARKNLKIKLTNARLKKEILGSQSHNVYSILSSVEQMTDSVELIARETVMDSGLDNTNTMAKKLSKEDDDCMNREIAEKISKMADDDNNRCTDGDAIDTAMEAEIPDAMDPEAEKSQNDDKALSERLGFNRFMIESIWKDGLVHLAANDVKATRLKKRKQDMRRRQINVAIRNTVSVGPLQRNDINEDVLVEKTCGRKKYVGVSRVLCHKLIDTLNLLRIINVFILEACTFYPLRQ